MEHAVKGIVRFDDAFSENIDAANTECATAEGNEIDNNRQDDTNDASAGCLRYMYVRTSESVLDDFVVFKKQKITPEFINELCSNRIRASVDAAGRHEPPETPIPEHVETKKPVRVPQIQSMDDYVKRHYSKELMDGMLEDIRQADGRRCQIEEVFEDTFHIGGISYWRENRTAFIALLKMQLDVSEKKSDNIKRYEYAAEIYFDFSDEIEYKEIVYRPFNRRAERDKEETFKETMWRLDEYLIPYARNLEIENRAWDLHCQYFREERNADAAASVNAVETDTRESDKRSEAEIQADKKSAIQYEFNGFELASRMGLEIRPLPLYKQQRRKSFINFCKGAVQILESDSDTDQKRPIWIGVPAKTIVLNSNRMESDEGEMSVFHECIHWEWHYLFYCLQALHNSDISALQKRHTVEQDKSNVEKSLSCMEYQANRGKYALKMPRPIMNPMIAALMRECRPGSQHEGQMLEKVARRIIDERGVRPYLVRARLIQLGHIGAKGILNYEDGRYITPFAFDHDNGSGDRVFFIRRKEALDEYRNNKEFRARIQSGNYVYADGHLCINDPMYVYQTGSGMRMTSAAKAHVDECCLRFISVYEMIAFAEYEFGRLASDEEYNGHYLNFLGNDVGKGKADKTDENGLAMARAKQIQANYQYAASLPDDFFEMLKVLRKDKKLSQEKLEEKSRVSRNSLWREKKKAKPNVTLDEAIAISIALEAPPWLSKVILLRAGITLNPANPLHQVYEYILSCMFMEPIDRIQEFLKSSNLPELTLNVNDSNNAVRVS